MVPLIVLVTSFAIFLVLYELKCKPLGSWVVCLRRALAAMFLLTASAHWGTRRPEPDLVAMIPDVFPNPELLAR